MSQRSDDKSTSTGITNISVFDSPELELRVVDEYASNFQREKDKREQRDFILRMTVLIIVGVGGLSMLGLAGYIATRISSELTAIMPFLATGVVLISFAVTAVMGVAFLGRTTKIDSEKREGQYSSYVEELRKERD